MISTWVWSRLPGNAWIKTALVVVALLALTMLLFEVVFPWVSPLLPFQEQTVEG
jgi:hypothetical protein